MLLCYYVIVVIMNACYKLYVNMCSWNVYTR